MTLTGAEQELLERIRDARSARTPIPSLGVELDLDAGYRVQASAAGNRLLRGYKLGLLSEAKQRQMGIAEPIYGRLYADMLLSSPAPLTRFLQPRVEPELAVVLRRDVPPGSPPGRAAAAFGGFFLALDVLDSVWQDYRFTAAEVVADNASGGGFALGGTLLPPGELPGQLRLFVNGSPRSEGATAALGDLGLRLAWLAGRVGGLREGQVVLLGSPAAAVPAEVGVVEVWAGSHTLAFRFEP